MVKNAENAMKFETFVEQMAAKVMPVEVLEQFIERDNESVLPKLKFAGQAFAAERGNSKVRQAIESYDVDDAVLQLMRDLEAADQVDVPSPLASSKASPVLMRAGTGGDKFKVVAEGDSWFRLPNILGIWPTAIADMLSVRGNVKLSNIAKWGHTLDQMLAAKEYMSEIQRVSARGFILSAGGNDLQEGLASKTFIEHYHPNRQTENYLSKVGLAELNRIGMGYRKILKEVTQEFPRVKIWLHGYDYPQPLLHGGQYVGQHMREIGIPEHKMSPILNRIIDLLNYRIEAAAGEYVNATYINCRNITTSTKWFDDMHPRTKGFKILAKRFERAILH